MSNSSETDVLIVGGGPVGLAMSLFLGQQGVKSLVVERHATTTTHPKARGINYRSMELFRGLGLSEPVREAGAALAGNQLMLVVDTLAGRELHRGGGMPDADRIAKLTPEEWCMCAQDELEPVLLEAIRQRGGEVRFNNLLLSLEQSVEGVTAMVDDIKAGQVTKIHATYLIGADGAHSFVRHLSMVANMEGRGTLERYMSLYFRADLTDLVRDRQFGMCFVQNPAARGALMAVNNTDRWVFQVPYLPENGQSAEDFTPERCKELIRTAVGVPDLEIELLSVQPWEATCLVADRYSQGRVFLVGDAAHQMPPSGAFGLNTGLQDAHNLAWKLAGVLKGWASPALLDTYEAERRPVGQYTVEQAGLRLDFRARRPGPPPQDGPKPADDLVVILGYRYGEDVAPEPLDLRGQPGSRAPHVWLERDGNRISTLDLFGQNFVLLTGPGGEKWREAAHHATQERNLPLKVYEIGPNGDLQDPTNAWLDTYNLSEAGAVLIRPDGFVALRAADTAGDEQEFLKTVLSALYL